jgi:hypothetical protein
MDSVFGFLKDKGMDYVGEMPDESFFTGEANGKYISDEKKIFTLSEQNDILDTIEIQTQIQSEDHFIVGMLKKDDRIMLNDLNKGKKTIKPNQRTRKKEMGRGHPR